MIRVIRTPQNLTDANSDVYLEAIKDKAAKEGIEVRIITKFPSDYDSEFTQARLDLYLRMFDNCIVLEPCEFQFDRERTLDKYLMAKAILEVIESYGNHLNVTIINRSEAIGKPLLKMLIEKDHTVSMCHSKTFRKDLVKMCYDADIVVSATGHRQRFLKDILNKVIDVSGDTRLPAEMQRLLLAGQEEIREKTIDLLFKEII